MLLAETEGKAIKIARRISVIRRSTRRYSKHNRTLTLHIQFKFVRQNSILPDYCLASVIIFMRILFRDRDIEKPVVKGCGSLEAF